ncbi:hypothetical protein TNCV_4820811 [Trichonephila clavipes]|nr:hypothetical protein TNCV_4820811 [Trichonephila clavipes]
MCAEKCEFSVKQVFALIFQRDAGNFPEISTVGRNLKIAILESEHVIEDAFFVSAAAEWLRTCGWVGLWRHTRSNSRESAKVWGASRQWIEIQTNEVCPQYPSCTM